MEDLRRIIRAFERSASSYDDWYGKPVGVYAFKSELNGLRSLLPISGIGLDIGAGTGIFAEHLSTVERIIICLDPSSNMIEKAANRGLVVILATAENIPLRSGILDFAYMVTVLEFVPNSQDVLNSINPVLKEDASLVSVFINRESAWGSLYSKRAENEESIFHFSRLYTLAEVCRFLHESGYDIEKIVGTLTSPPDKPSDEIDLTSDTSKAGVILLKARKNCA
ncbi:methyltransferase domain-containing protein [Candidatus Bathyarchaeota archaeon]|nr:methyltransferase domain-containing protein [Candidatus Bathyarchaeota archaeon]